MVCGMRCRGQASAEDGQTVSAARFRRIHERQVGAMLYRAVWGDFHCYAFVVDNSNQRA